MAMSASDTAKGTIQERLDGVTVASFQSNASGSPSSSRVGTSGDSSNSSSPSDSPLPSPGEVWKVKESNAHVEVVALVDEDEYEPWVRGYELEGPLRARTRRCFRAIRVSRLERRVSTPGE